MSTFFDGDYNYSNVFSNVGYGLYCAGNFVADILRNKVPNVFHNQMKNIGELVTGRSSDTPITKKTLRKKSNKAVRKVQKTELRIINLDSEKLKKFILDKAKEGAISSAQLFSIQIFFQSCGCPIWASNIISPTVKAAYDVKNGAAAENIAESFGKAVADSSLSWIRPYIEGSATLILTPYISSYFEDYTAHWPAPIIANLTAKAFTGLIIGSAKKIAGNTAVDIAKNNVDLDQLNKLLAEFNKKTAEENNNIESPTPNIIRLKPPSHTKGIPRKREYLERKCKQTPNRI